MSLFSENHSLKSLNTFGIDVKARYYAEAEDIDQLREIYRNPPATDNPVLVLGGGSNILFTGDYPGLVVRTTMKDVIELGSDDHFVWIKTGAGKDWHTFVMECVRKNLGGIENLSLIPGTVGAAPIQNIGAYGVELKEVFEELEAMEIDTGNLVTYRKNQCGFGYRNSIFKNEAKGKYIILSVTLRLTKQHTYNISYGSIRETMESMHIHNPSLKAISDAVIAIRNSKLPNPDKLGNAGSFFKNPVIDKIDFEGLRAEFPDMPGFPVETNQIKVPAGWLIERCGWKGKRIGNAGVHRKQALVLVNYGGSTGQQIKDLGSNIRDDVMSHFGIILEPEVTII